MLILNTFLLLFITVSLYLYWIWKKSFRFFEKNGIPFKKPMLLFGNTKDAFLKKKSILTVHHEIYNKLESEKFVGIFTMIRPGIMIRDPELIKQVLVKDFSYFHDRGNEIPRDIEPLLYNLFSMRGDEWKNLRIKLTTMFSSGKMKNMFSLIKKCAEGFEPALEQCLHDNDGIEMKDFCARYTTDVIGCCAFGLETHSLKDPESEFRKMGKRLFKLKKRTAIRFAFPRTPKFLVKLLRLEVFEPKVVNYFINIVKETIKYREQNNVRRNDFLELLICLKNNTEIDKLKNQDDDKDLEKFLSEIGDKYVKSDVAMDMDLLLSHCLVFFLAGFEATASTLSFILLELAYASEIQEKLRKEITSTLEKYNGEFSYEAVKKMNYADLVLMESQRKYPVAGSLQRSCIKNYKIPDTDIILKENTEVIIPVYGLHMDPKYYEKPLEFYPEHFTEEAIAKRPHYAYMPFGEGPRVCIAERFAKLIVKVALVHLIKNYEFSPNSKTKMPPEFNSGFELLNVKGGVWLNVRKI